MPPIFQSFLQGGFEGSTHRRLDGHRLDIIAASGHDKLAMIDYALASDAGLSTIRDTLRWQLIEQTPGQYDWSTVQPIMAAARACKTQIVWDLCHFGIPQWLDIWSTDFIERFAAYAAAAAAHLSSSTDTISVYCPINRNFLLVVGGRRYRDHLSIWQSEWDRTEATIGKSKHCGYARRYGALTFRRDFCSLNRSSTSSRGPIGRRIKVSRRHIGKPNLTVGICYQGGLLPNLAAMKATLI